MQERNSVANEQLYQSQWWTRLAAFSEQRESQAPVASSRESKKEQSSFSRTLVSLLRAFHPNQKWEVVAQFLTPN